MKVVITMTSHKCHGVSVKLSTARPLQQLLQINHQSSALFAFWSGNPQVAHGLRSQMVSNVESFPYRDVIIYRVQREVVNLDSPPSNHKIASTADWAHRGLNDMVARGRQYIKMYFQRFYRGLFDGKSVFFCFISLTPFETAIIFHYGDVIMGTMASQITRLTIVYSTVYSGADQRKHQSSASLAFLRWIHLGPVNSPHKWPVTRNMFLFDDIIMSRPVMTEFMDVNSGLIEAWTFGY